MRISWRIRIGLTLIHHLFLTGNTATNIKLFAKLFNMFRPLRRAGLVKRGTILSYLSVFLSRSLSTRQKLEISTHHYAFLQAVFSAEQLSALFNEGIEFYAEQNSSDLLNILLVHSPAYIYEGPCALTFNVNGTEYARISFMMAPGYLFGLDDLSVFYISCMQKKHSEEGTSKITHVNSIHPVTTLLKVLKAFGSAHGIDKSIAVAAENQLSYIPGREDYDYFFSLYDDFWLSKGGSVLGTDYLLPFPLVQKPILDIKQTHRNRIRKKRTKLQQIHNAVYNRFKH